MPNVIGLEYEAALASMQTAGVRVLPLGYFQPDPVAIQWLADRRVPKSVVLAQFPFAGTAGVAANSPATLLVSNFRVSVADVSFTGPGAAVPYPMCTVNGLSAIPGLAIPGCMIPGQAAQ
jgi:hypothetical protein